MNSVMNKRFFYFSLVALLLGGGWLAGTAQATPAAPEPAGYALTAFPVSDSEPPAPPDLRLASARPVRISANLATAASRPARAEEPAASVMNWFAVLAFTGLLGLLCCTRA